MSGSRCGSAEAGHEIAWAQLPAGTPAGASRSRTAPAARCRRGPAGSGTFDALSGALTHLGGIPVTGPRLDVWRAPTGNDNGAPWQPDSRHGLVWRELGLHRMRHRLDAWNRPTRRRPYGPASPPPPPTSAEGEWSCPLPRLGVRLGLPAAYGRAQS